MRLGFTVFMDASKAKYSVFSAHGQSSSSLAPQTVRPCIVCCERGDSMNGVITVVMILRVWRLYSRSRVIIGVLLTLYLLEMVPFIVACINLSTPNELTGV